MLFRALAHRHLDAHRVRAGLALAIYLASGAYAVGALWTFPQWTVDDAYIAFRYAHNLVAHGQLSWNVGAPPVEGYTGIALPLVVAAGLKVGLAPEALTRGVGIAALGLGAWTVRDNQRLLGVREPVRAYVTALPLVWAPMLAHATSGLETLPFAALLGACLGALLRCEQEPTTRAQAVLWAELLLLSFIRPEGVLCAAVFGGALAAALARRRSTWRRPMLLALAVYGLPYGAYFAWRAHHYGRLLPNTFYAKQAPGWDGGFLEVSLVLLGAFLPLLLAGAVTAIARRRPGIPRLAGAAVAVLLMAATVTYSRSTLIMGYLFRFQTHFVLLALPLLGAWLGDPAVLARLPERCGAARGRLLAGLAGCLILGAPADLLADSSAVRAQCRRYRDAAREQLVPIGVWVRDRLPLSEAVACYVDAGIVPYMAPEHAAIDFGRLSDAYLAQPGRTPREVADYFFALRPGALIITSDSPVQVAPQYGAAIVTADPRFVEYERVGTYCSPEYPRTPCEMLFMRRGVALR